MSEDLYGVAETERWQGYKPMPLANEAPKESADPYEGITPQEAVELLHRPESPTPEVPAPEQAEVIERQYNYSDGSRAGTKMPDNQTISAEQAAADLTALRETEQVVDETVRNAELVETLRAEKEESERLDRVARGLEEPQQPSEQVVPSDDAIWQHPQVRAKVSEYTNQLGAAAQQVQAQYAQEVIANHNQAAIAVTAAFPELQGLDVSQIPTAMQLIARTNPQRAKEIHNQIQNLKLLSDKANAAQAQQAQVQQANFRRQWDATAKQADEAFGKWMETTEPNAERREEIARYSRQILRDEGLSDQEINHHWNTSPVLRSVAGQKILADAARYRMGKAAAKTKTVRQIPIVQRPGSPLERGTNEEYSMHQLNEKLNNASRPKDQLVAAAQLVAARRRGRGR